MQALSNVTNTPVPMLPLKLEQLYLRKGHQNLLNGIDLEVDNDDLTIIIGPNGAGKTLLLRTCHGLEQPTSGAVRWNAADCFTNPCAQAMVFQRPVVLKRTVAENIDYALGVCKFSKGKRKQRLQSALELAGLQSLANRSARVLSGGEQQRLTLARAWAIKPQILFLDEPSAHLDPSATHNIEEIIFQIKTEGTKIIMTTHDLGQAKRLADEIIFIHSGRILERGSADDFFKQPKTTEASAFIKGELLW